MPEITAPNPFGGVVDLAEVSFRGAMVPIGGIIPWLKSLTGVPALPAEWHECDGSVLSDADSLLNGQTIPDLNGAVSGGLKGRFLRGDATSGTTQAGAIEAHTHSYYVADNAHQTATGATAYGQTISAATSGSTGGTETRPYAYTVVFIVRVK